MNRPNEPFVGFVVALLMAVACYAVIVFMCAGLWWTVGVAFGMVQP